MRKLILFFIFYNLIIICFGAESETIKVTDKSYFRSFFKKETIQEIEKKSDDSKINAKEPAAAPPTEVKKEPDNPFTVPEIKKEIIAPLPANNVEIRRAKISFNYSISKLNENVKKLKMYITKKNNIIRIDKINKEDKLEYLYGKDDMVLLLNNTEVKQDIKRDIVFSIVRNGLNLRIKSGEKYIKAKSGIKMKLFVKEFQDGIY